MAEETPNLPAKAGEFTNAHLSELFQKSPLDITDDEFRQMIAAFRQQRGQWVAEEAQAKAQTRRTDHKSAGKVSLTAEQQANLLEGLEI